MLALSVGDRLWGRAWGTVPSNSSWRKTAEYVRLASSATGISQCTQDRYYSTHSSESAARGAGFALRFATALQVSPLHGEDCSSPEDLVLRDSE
jgi:hypothetical protein